MLKDETAQAGNDVVESDELAGAVGSLDPEETLRRLGRVMGAAVERALTGNPDLCVVWLRRLGRARWVLMRPPRAGQS